MSSTVAIKASLNDDLRRLSVPRNISLQELQDALRARFDTEHEFSLKWLDEESDHVTIQTLEDLQEAFGNSEKLRLFLVPREMSAADRRHDSSEQLKDTFKKVATDVRANFGIELPEETIENLSRMIPVIRNTTETFAKAAEQKFKEAEQAMPRGPSPECFFDQTNGATGCTGLPAFMQMMQGHPFVAHMKQAAEKIKEAAD